MDPINNYPQEDAPEQELKPINNFRPVRNDHMRKEVSDVSTLSDQIERLGETYARLLEINNRHQETAEQLRGVYIVEETGLKSNMTEPESMLDKFTMLNDLIYKQLDQLQNTHDVLRRSL